MSRAMRGAAVWLVVCVSLALGACGDGSVFFAQEQLPAGGWPAAREVEFVVPYVDTLLEYDLDFVLEHGDEYPNANLYLFARIDGPHGLRRADTLHYQLATERGAWLGEGFAGEWEVLLPYAAGARFAQAGAYRVRVQHGMRYDTLRGVRSVALRVRRTPIGEGDGKE